jgi:hypothetical protein
MRRMSWIVLSWLLTGCAVGGGAAATPVATSALRPVTPAAELVGPSLAAETPAPETVAATPTTHPDAAGVAESLGISIEEAQRRLGFQEAIGRLSMTIEAEHPDTFAGLWIEHEPVYKVVVAFTADAEATLRPYVAGTRLEAIVEARTFLLSYATLRQTQQTLLPLFDLGPTMYSSGIDVPTNRVVLEVADPAAFLAAVAAEGIELPSYVVIQQGAPLILE